MEFWAKGNRLRTCVYPFMFVYATYYKGQLWLWAMVSRYDQIKTTLFSPFKLVVCESLSLWLMVGSIFESQPIIYSLDCSVPKVVAPSTFSQYLDLEIPYCYHILTWTSVLTMANHWSWCDTLSRVSSCDCGLWTGCGQHLKMCNHNNTLPKMEPKHKTTTTLSLL